jgi:predicted RNA methylase
VVARCRAGLSQLLAAELSGRSCGADRVELEFSGTLASLLRARIALDFAIQLPLPPGDDVERAVAEALTSERAISVLTRWTDGCPSFRLAFASGGHRRASVFRIAELVRATPFALRNDPRQAAGEVRVDERARTLLLVPRRFTDPRFAYRRADVPAASHPTIAAALARAAGTRPGDVVWDPFCGSGLELIERGLLGDYQLLIGSDVSAAAIDAARVNVAASRLPRVQLHQAHATEYAPPGVSLILTNPPMGRRVARGHAPELLLDFLQHAARVLLPHGRLVWLAPFGRNDLRQARELGWTVTRGGSVDLGGFSAELQILRRA